jgi:hypothetical protein
VGADQGAQGGDGDGAAGPVVDGASLRLVFRLAVGADQGAQGGDGDGAAGLVVDGAVGV